MTSLFDQVVKLQNKETKRRQRREWWAETYHSVVFISLLLGMWLLHILTGWFRWAFFPEGWKGKLSEAENGWGAHQYDNDSDTALTTLKNLHDEDVEVMFVRRIHPFFLDNELLYVYSPNYKARLWDGEEKLL